MGLKDDVRKGRNWLKDSGKKGEVALKGVVKDVKDTIMDSVKNQVASIVDDKMGHHSPPHQLLSDDMNHQLHDCPEGFTRISTGKCLFVIMEKLSWYSAEITCSNDLGGHLLTVSTANESEAVMKELIIPRQSLLQGVDGSVWIGLTNINNIHDRFEWYSSGENIVLFSNWNQGEPNSPHVDHCAAMYFVNGRWNDVCCDIPLPSICEYQGGFEQLLREESPLLTITVKNQKKYGNPCSKGFEYWMGECYWINLSEKNYFDASNDCHEKGGHLVSIVSHEQDRWLKEYVRHYGLLRKNLWIGMNDISKEGDLVWLNGNEVNYKHFANGQPSNGQDENCVILWGDANGQWDDQPCHAKFRSICKWTESIVMTVPSVDCPKDFISWQGYCYFIENKDLSFFDAHENCNSKDSELVTITSQSQNRWLFELLRIYGLSRHHVWIGLHDIDIENTFQWLDGTPLTEGFFANSQPDNSREEEHCGMYWGDIGSEHWNDAPCSVKTKSICLWNHDRRFSLTSNPCPDKRFIWWPWTSKCYLIPTELSLNYFEAAKYCNQEGHGYLTSIHSTRENRRLYELLRLYGLVRRDVWIGLNDIDEEKNFQWLDQTAVTFRGFSGAQPDNDRGREHCVGFWSTWAVSSWNDFPCTTQSNFICEWNKTLTIPSPVFPIQLSNQSLQICPSKFFFWNNHCYYLEKVELVSFSWANEACSKLLSPEEAGEGFKSNLVRIDSPSANRWVYELIRLEDEKSGNPHQWWIGLHDLNRDGTYVWSSSRDNSNDTSMSWQFFYQNRPDKQPKSPPHCVGFSKDLRNERWFDIPCETPSHYICEATKSSRPQQEPEPVISDVLLPGKIEVELSSDGVVQSSRIYEVEPILPITVPINENSKHITIDSNSVPHFSIKSSKMYSWRGYEVGIVIAMAITIFFIRKVFITNYPRSNNSGTIPSNTSHQGSKSDDSISRHEEEVGSKAPTNIQLPPNKIVNNKFPSSLEDALLLSPETVHFIVRRFWSEYIQKKKSVQIVHFENFIKLCNSLHEVASIETDEELIAHLEKLVQKRGKAQNVGPSIGQVSGSGNSLLAFLLFTYGSHPRLTTKYSELKNIVKDAPLSVPQGFEDELLKFYVPFDLLNIQEGDDSIIGRGRKKVARGRLIGRDALDSSIAVDVAIKLHHCDQCATNRWDWQVDLMNGMFSVGAKYVVQCYGYTRRPSQCHPCKRFTAFPCTITELAHFSSLKNALIGHQNVKLLLHKKKLNWIMHCLRGIEELHSRGIIHRDIKPDNILIFYDNDDIILKIGDLDLARCDHESSTNTGNEFYRAPERLEGKPAQLESDVYSWALIAVQILLYSDHFNQSNFDASHLNPMNRERCREQFNQYLRDLVHNLQVEELSYSDALSGPILLDAQNDNNEELVKLLMSCFNLIDRPEQQQVRDDLIGRPNARDVREKLEAIVSKHNGSFQMLSEEDRLEVNERLAKNLLKQ